MGWWRVLGGDIGEGAFDGKFRANSSWLRLIKEKLPSLRNGGHRLSEKYNMKHSRHSFILLKNYKWQVLRISCLFPGVPTRRFLNNFFLALQIFWGYSSSVGYFCPFYPISDFRLQGDQSLAFSSDFYAKSKDLCNFWSLYCLIGFSTPQRHQKLHKVWLELGNI